MVCCMSHKFTTWGSLRLVSHQEVICLIGWEEPAPFIPLDAALRDGEKRSDAGVTHRGDVYGAVECSHLAQLALALQRVITKPRLCTAESVYPLKQIHGSCVSLPTYTWRKSLRGPGPSQAARRQRSFTELKEQVKKLSQVRPSPFQPAWSFQGFNGGRTSSFWVHGWFFFMKNKLFEAIKASRQELVEVQRHSNHKAKVELCQPCRRSRRWKILLRLPCYFRLGVLFFSQDLGTLKMTEIRRRVMRDSLR